MKLKKENIFFQKYNLRHRSTLALYKLDFDINAGTPAKNLCKYYSKPKVFNNLDIP